LDEKQVVVLSSYIGRLCLLITTTILSFLSALSSVQNLAKIDAARKTKSQEKSGDNRQNQLLDSGEFLPEDRYENQEVSQPWLREAVIHLLYNTLSYF
jgi:hypothetical protein